MAMESIPQSGDTTIRVALYGRVSTHNHGQNVDIQLAELRQYAARRGFRVVEEYTDHISGSAESRPALNRLMADARRRRFDALLVWKLDRFARSLRHLVTALAELHSLGIAFISLSDNLDLSTPTGRLMFHVIGAMAEFERELCRERILAGQRHARAQGKHMGRPHAQVDLARAEQMRAEGMSWQQIGQRLKVPTGTLYRAWARSQATTMPQKS